MRTSTPGLIHLSIAESANRCPDKSAFRSGTEQLTYAELHDRVSRLAYTLGECGVRRGDRVGLHLNKSLESAIALFATMQAGAAYVPLDPSAPTDRLRAILQSCEARAVITHPPRARETELALDGSGVAAVVGLDAPVSSAAETVSWQEALASPTAPNLARGASELDLAYIIFTSGSTGAPKGIMHTHSSGMSYARMATQLYGLRGDDRLSNVSPLHFDMSTFDFFCAPLVAATTTIIPEAYLKLPASLTELIEVEQLTIWYSVPFALTQILQHGEIEARDLSSLRWILFGGEPFVPKHLAALSERLPKARFSNVYGPAEVNQCTWYNLDSPWHAELGQPPIGRACPNADLMVLDGEGQDLTPGKTGELAVRTPTMMLGYWRRPDLNGRAFLRRPDPGGIDQVFYLTGDLVSEDVYGMLRFHGRKDRQIKSRGYRVELDEVEEALAAHEAVAEAAAFPVSHDDGLVMIEAAVVLRTGRTVDDGALSRFAAERLPAYARPTRLSVLGTFPRTTSGKIDRKRLGDEASTERRGAA